MAYQHSDMLSFRNQEEFVKFSGSSQVASRNGLLRFLATNAAGALPIGNKIAPGPGPMP
jgi:hypothetical protein